MGRANFGAKMMRKKGIAGRCLLGSIIHFDWDVYCLEMNNLDKVVYSEKAPQEKSAFYKGTFTVDEAKDTFLKLPNFTKGFVTINGFNLGRYWEVGPQVTLYLPASLLNVGENEIVVFESDGLKGEPIVEFVDTPILDKNI
jgi:beta-galactosidase